MKKYLTLFTVLAIMLAFNIGTARADNSEADTLRAQAQEKMQSLMSVIKNEKDQAQMQIKADRITGRQKVLDRFDQITGSLSALEDRANTLITKLEARGVNVTDAKSSLAISDGKLTEIKSKVADINALLASSVEELSTEDKTNLKNLVQDVQTLINDARTALNDAVKSLKDAVANQNQ